MAIPPKKIVMPPPPKTDHTLGVMAWIGGIILLLFASRLIAAFGLDFFTWGDRSFGTIKEPIFLWAFAGILPGALIGAFVMGSKYRLGWAWKFGPLAALLILLGAVIAFTQPMLVYQPLQTASDVKPDTAHVLEDHPRHPNRRHHPRVVPDTALDQERAHAETSVQPGSSRLSEQGEIMVHARTDSVTLHYRLRAVHNGNWSEWQEKFVPSAGQALLTAGEVVKAHAVEWWFEVGGIATRSAGSPFRKDHCDGALVVDTY